MKNRERYDAEFYKDQNEAAHAIVGLLQRIEELEERIDMLAVANNLKSGGY